MSFPILIRRITTTATITSTATNTLRTLRHHTARTRTMSSASTIYDFTATKQLGEPLPMSQLKGKVILIVNVASKSVSLLLPHHCLPPLPG